MSLRDKARTLFVAFLTVMLWFQVCENFGVYGIVLFTLGTILISVLAIAFAWRK